MARLPRGMTKTSGRTIRLKRFLFIPRYAGAARKRINRGGNCAVSSVRTAPAVWRSCMEGESLFTVRPSCVWSRCFDSYGPHTPPFLQAAIISAEATARGLPRNSLLFRSSPARHLAASLFVGRGSIALWGIDRAASGRGAPISVCGSGALHREHSGAAPRAGSARSPTWTA